MEDSHELQAARAMRRAMLGDGYVDARTADPNPVMGEFQDDVTSMAWGVWTRGGALSPRDRSLLVLAMTAALGRMEEFGLHAGAMDRGLHAHLPVRPGGLAVGDDGRSAGSLDRPSARSLERSLDTISSLKSSYQGVEIPFSICNNGTGRHPWPMRQWSGSKEGRRGGAGQSRG